MRPADLLQRARAALANDYDVIREVGRGGTSIVFLARDIRQARDVAIKILRPEFAAIVGGDRFRREIDIAASLNHPHILPLHDSGEADGLLY
jgi:serine/threonine-protein kinase